MSLGGFLCYFLCYFRGRNLALNESLVKIAESEFRPIKSMVSHVIARSGKKWSESANFQILSPVRLAGLPAPAVNGQCSTGHS